MTSWADHLPRIAAMNFDWVYLNPFHYSGFSGSLYAVKDFDRLHPVIQGESTDSPDELVRGFAAAAGRLNIRVMVDLVINHTARDSRLVEERPEWFRRESDGSLRSPRAVDPLDPRRFTVWGDLAEIDYDNAVEQPAQLAHWSALIARYLDLGVRGFRCDAAYQVPAAVWQSLIAKARQRRPDCIFAAETLGCTPEQAQALGGAGFDYLFNSAKWWDFRGDWLLRQYDLYRRIAPTIAFPESHDTARLAADPPDDDPARLSRRARFRYLFAATFSNGVMMPMGYEYGCAKRLDVVQTRPGDWTSETETPRFDLTAFIGEANRLAARHPALQVEGCQRQLTAPDSPVVGLLRLDGEDVRTAGAALVTLLNPDPLRAHGIDPGRILAVAGGRFGAFRDVTPGAPPLGFQPGTMIALGPEEARVFACDRPDVPAGRVRLPSRAQSARRIHALAGQRVAIENIFPEIDGGRFPVKRVVGDVVDVWADIFADGHDVVGARLRYRQPGQQGWLYAPMTKIDNDRWRARLPLTRIGRWDYTVEAWQDRFRSWREEVGKKRQAGLDLTLEWEEGRRLVEAVIGDADATDAELLRAALDDEQPALLAAPVAAAMDRATRHESATCYEPTLAITVDRPAARFAAWYELFPRSTSGDPARHGTFDDVIARLPYVRGMGFDVLYFPPIHPIGQTNRKGRNNSLTAGSADPGSPYAIGAAEGGHDAVHPELGTLDDFRRLVAAAAGHGLEIALDFAIQCSPDHPWLKQHPEWFDWRPDGSIKYAENPPKKYEDIVNVHFYGTALPGVWLALRDVVLFWAEQGVRIFRVDNPHTKPLPFWEWMIAEVQAQHPDVIFLAEAFTRPKLMNRLAKLGFTQSYTYFTWRNTKRELTDYLTELTQGPAREFFRPNFFANTPDINPMILQGGEPAAFKMRLVLAALLSGVYGIYSGFELSEGAALPGREEYLDSEKYEIRVRDDDGPGNIRDYVARINAIRRDNPALHDHLNLRFYNTWNDQILLFGRITAEKDNAILVAVNLDTRHPQEAQFEVPLWEFGLPDDATLEAVDLFADRRMAFHGKMQRIWLDPKDNPCAIWRLIPPGSGHA